jgi:hypothetical protein
MSETQKQMTKGEMGERVGVSRAGMDRLRFTLGHTHTHAHEHTYIHTHIHKAHSHAHIHT